jgi:hypothetical protein
LNWAELANIGRFPAPVRQVTREGLLKILLAEMPRFGGRSAGATFGGSAVQAAGVVFSLCHSAKAALPVQARKARHLLQRRHPSPEKFAGGHRGQPGWHVPREK